MYEKRFYREFTKNNLKNTNITVVESDLEIYYSSTTNELESIIKTERDKIIKYINKYPIFNESLEPIEVLKEDSKIIKQMKENSKLLDVGPMATIAGAINHISSEYLSKYNDEYIIENGGDLIIKTNTSRNILIYAGNSPLSNKVKIKIKASEKPVAICTSSGNLGHSLSFGRTDAVVALSDNSFLADAAATKIGNLVKSEDDIEKAIRYCKKITGLKGVMIIIGDKLGIYGDIHLIK